MYVRVCVCLRCVFMLVFDSTYVVNKDEYNAVTS